jgi:hypothetical protein
LVRVPRSAKRSKISSFYGENGIASLASLMRPGFWPTAFTVTGTTASTEGGTATRAVGGSFEGAAWFLVYRFHPHCRKQRRVRAGSAISVRSGGLVTAPFPPLAEMTSADIARVNINNLKRLYWSR